MGNLEFGLFSLNPLADISPTAFSICHHIDTFHFCNFLPFFFSLLMRKYIFQGLVRRIPLQNTPTPHRKPSGFKICEVVWLFVHMAHCKVSWGLAGKLMQLEWPQKMTFTPWLQFHLHPLFKKCIAREILLFDRRIDVKLELKFKCKLVGLSIGWDLKNLVHTRLNEPLFCPILL